MIHREKAKGLNMFPCLENETEYAHRRKRWRVIGGTVKGCTLAYMHNNYLAIVVRTVPVSFKPQGNVSPFQFFCIAVRVKRHSGESNVRFAARSLFFVYKCQGWHASGTFRLHGRHRDSSHFKLSFIFSRVSTNYRAKQAADMRI